MLCCPLECVMPLHVAGVPESIRLSQVFAAHHQNGITYLVFLILDPSVNFAEMWNFITLNKCTV